VVLCVTPPPVPVTAIVVVPFLAFLAAAMVMTDDPVPGAGMGFGLKLTITRLPCPEADNEIAELKPFKAAVLMVEVPELPRATVSEVGKALMLKSGGAVTVTLTVVECVAVPSVPVTVSVYVPAAAEPAFTVRVELLPAVTDVGLSEALAPLGAPETVRATVPALPEVTAVEIVLVPEVPCTILKLVGLAEMEKSFGGLVTVTLAVPLTPPLAAVTVKGPPAVEPAVNSPEALMVPPPLTDQLNVGWGLIGLPN
jgi:hypothetical protein